MQEREVVLTKREVEARLVPSGTEIMIPSDTFVTITQSLGGTFTVAVNGNLARIEGQAGDKGLFAQNDLLRILPHKPPRIGRCAGCIPRQEHRTDPVFQQADPL